MRSESCSFIWQPNVVTWYRFTRESLRMRAVFIDHINVPVRDLDACKRFYRAALEPFGAHVVEEPGPPEGWGPALMIGPPGSEDLGFSPGDPTAAIHIAFAAPDRATVDAFHAAALAAGGTDNGAPGLRPQYHAGYYGAYVLDPDGNNVEAVFHDESASS
jgi:catechol 2,3-dioxygenase-like lactoylglutathione lyase family enzyme